LTTEDGLAWEREHGFGSLLLGISLCSVAVLMQEILLTRIYSLTIWYHLAYLTVSTALLGFGAAGSLLASYPWLLENGARRLSSGCAAAAGIALVAAMAILGPRPLDPDRLLSDPGPLLLGLLGYYALTTAPFFLAGIAIAAPLSAHPKRANRLYAADLLGAGLGCALAVAALTWVDGAAAVALCAALFFASAAAYAPRRRNAAIYVAAAALLVVSSPAADRLIEFKPSSSKALAVSLQNPRTQVLYTRWSPVNRVDLFREPGSRGGWWGAKGISPHYRGPKPRTMSIQYDGHNGSDVFEWRGPGSFEMLDHHVLRTPYVVRERPSVLVIGVGGGVDMVNALRRGASHVMGVDLQPITIELHNGMLKGWMGGLLQSPRVSLVAAEGRHYVRSSGQQFDLVQITAVDTFSAQSTGAYVLAESYLYTVEAFEDYFQHLNDDGAVSLIIGDSIYEDASLAPPLVTRLTLVAREALERAGSADPGQHLLIVAHPSIYGGTEDGGVRRGTWVQNLIAKKTPFTADELTRVRRFVEEEGFQTRLAPGLPGQPALARIVQSGPAERAAALAAQPFIVEPVTDDRPFFFHVLPWGSLLEGKDIFWMFPGSATGQLVLLAMLGQSLLLGALLILAPLARSGMGALARGTAFRFLLYFLGLGLGFLLIEISFVQKYVLVLGYPTYSLSVTIFSLLIFAALGAYLSEYGWERPRAFLTGLLAVTATLIVIEVLLLPWIRDWSLSSPLPVRIAITAGLQLPLGITLGMYFPTGLELLRRIEPRLIPWAWAVNGVGSVIATVLAVILGIEFGFSAVALIAIGVYAVGTIPVVIALREGGSLARPTT